MNILGVSPAINHRYEQDVGKQYSKCKRKNHQRLHNIPHRQIVPNRNVLVSGMVATAIGQRWRYQDDWLGNHLPATLWSHVD